MDRQRLLLKVRQNRLQPACHKMFADLVRQYPRQPPAIKRGANDRIIAAAEQAWLDMDALLLVLPEMPVERGKGSRGL